MDFVKEVIRQTAESEPPKDYFYWASLSVIAAVTKGKVFLDRHFYKLYPNIYVLLLGKSGLRKSAVINFAKKMVSMANTTRVISGRNTVEAIINTLSKDYTLDGGTLIKRATGFLVASEFSNLIQDNDAALTILTDLYDTGYHEDGWKNTLKGTGSETLRGVNLTMLGASNLTHLENTLQAKDIMGGFIARTYLIDAKKKRTLNPLVRKPESVINYKKLMAWIDVIKTLEGEFDWDPDAAEYYEQWYLEYNRKQEERENEELSEDTGSSSRFEDHILKVAMLLSLSRSTDLTLTREVIEEAIDVCFGFLHTVENLMLTGKKNQKNDSQEKGRLVIMELIAAPEKEYVTRAKILRRHWGKLRADELDIIVKTLNQSELIEVQEGRDGTRYRLATGVRERLRGKQ